MLYFWCLPLELLLCRTSIVLLSRLTLPTCLLVRSSTLFNRYQGEANAGDPVSYACRFPSMISDWRKKFNLPDLSFFYVQLAGYPDGKRWAYLRASQSAALRLPKVGFATAIDLADPVSPRGSIHPRRKQEVGRRLSLSARVIQYKERSGLVNLGPTLTGVQLGSGESSITRLSFVPGTADGLHLHGSAACNICCTELPFEVMDSLGNWTRVDAAQVRNEEVFLTTNIKQIFGIRYAWEPMPQCILYSGVGGADDHSGLAAAPFEWCPYPSGKGAWTGDVCEVRGMSQVGLTM